MSIDSVTIYPVFNQAFLTYEHAEGELQYLGDALGRDFIAAKFFDGFMRFYKDDGSNNYDWFGYRIDVLAPCDAVVEKVRAVTEENTPGSHTNKPSGSVVFRCEDGTRILYGHLTEINVKPDEHVKKGQIFAKCGNNGTSWHPHVHVGAWKNDKPLQIRVDLKALGQILKEQGDSYHLLPNDKVTAKRFNDSFNK